MNKCEHNYLPYYKRIVGWKKDGWASRYDWEVVETVYCTKCLERKHLDREVIN